jgi:hypothetical protein
VTLQITVRTHYINTIHNSPNIDTNFGYSSKVNKGAGNCLSQAYIDVSAYDRGGKLILLMQRVIENVTLKSPATTWQSQGEIWVKSTGSPLSNIALMLDTDVALADILKRPSTCTASDERVK